MVDTCTNGSITFTTIDGDVTLEKDRILEDFKSLVKSRDTEHRLDEKTIEKLFECCRVVLKKLNNTKQNGKKEEGGGMSMSQFFSLRI